jgi:hypothetical protein
VGASEAAQVRDYEPVRLSPLDTLDRLHQEGPITPTTRLIELLEDVADKRAPQLRPALDLLALHDRRHKALARPPLDLGDAHVSVKNHWDTLFEGRSCPPAHWVIRRLARG